MIWLYSKDKSESIHSKLPARYKGGTSTLL